MSQHVHATHNFLAEIHRAGCDPSYGMPTLFQARENLLLVMLNHEYGIKAFDAAAISDATLRARAEIFKIVRALNRVRRRLGRNARGGQRRADRRSRRPAHPRPLYGDARGPRQWRAARGRRGAVTFGADVHAATREKNRQETVSHGGLAFRPYDIPLRALLAKDVDGLLMAGRCISGDFLAHASYRVTGDAVAMGEAAGAVAALAARSKCPPHEVPWEEAAALR